VLDLQGFEYVHVEPEAHVVHPVYVEPPHLSIMWSALSLALSPSTYCPYFATVQEPATNLRQRVAHIIRWNLPEVEVEVVDVVVDVVVEVEVEVVVVVCQKVEHRRTLTVAGTYTRRRRTSGG